MANINIRDAYREAYGSSKSLALDALTGKVNYDEPIFAQIQALADSGEIDLSNSKRTENFLDIFSSYTLGDALFEIDAKLIGEIESAYFSRTTRETALVVLNNVLVPKFAAALTIVDGLTCTSGDYMQKWNKAHPNEKPIGINPDYLP